MDRSGPRFGTRQLCGKIPLPGRFPSFRGVEGEVQGRGVEPSLLACLHSSDGLSRGGAAHHRQWLQERGGKSPEQCLQVSNCHFGSSILVEIFVIKIRYKCYSGFRLMGARSVHCDGHSWVTNDLPICTSLYSKSLQFVMADNGPFVGRGCDPADLFGSEIAQFEHGRVRSIYGGAAYRYPISRGRQYIF